MPITCSMMEDRLNKVLESRPEEVPEEDRVNENYLKLQIKTAITFMKQQESEIRREKIRVKKAVRVINSLGKFIANFGFKKIGEVYGEDYTHKSLTACVCCGYMPVIQASSYEEGKWLTKCLKCDLSTDPKAKIMDAIKAWNNHEFSEASEMFNMRYSKETIDENGMIELVKEACKVAADDYIMGDKTTKKDVEKFFQTSNFMMKIDRDALIEKLDKEAAERQKAGA